MSSNYLLSICIPTFNRSALLQKTIVSIVNDPLFASDKVEIVVSDNASTDDTEIVMKNYCDKYSNLTYTRNLNNNGFMNIFTVLNLARGEFCKVINDYTILNKNTLEKLLSIIETNIESKPQIFFGYGWVKSKADGILYSFDEFLSTISYWCTFVGGFCIWKNDFDLIKHNTLNEMFPHTSLLFYLENKNQFFIENNSLFTSQDIKTKGGYNLFEVFAVQFIEMLISIKTNGIITEKTYNKIKKDMLYHFFPLWYHKLIIQKDKAIRFEYKNIKTNFLVYYSNFEYVMMCICGRMYSFITLIEKIKKLPLKLKRK